MRPNWKSLKSRIFVNGGTFVNALAVSRRKGERDKAIQRAKDAVAEIDAAGVQVKDLDIGLLDFPCVVGDEVILLCWKLGEQGITHWHSTSEGFAGRKPIDERHHSGPEEVQLDLAHRFSGPAFGLGPQSPS